MGVGCGFGYGCVWCGLSVVMTGFEEGKVLLGLHGVWVDT